MSRDITGARIIALIVIPPSGVIGGAVSRGSHVLDTTAVVDVQDVESHIRDAVEDVMMVMMIVLSHVHPIREDAGRDDATVRNSSVDGARLSITPVYSVLGRTNI